MISKKKLKDIGKLLLKVSVSAVAIYFVVKRIDFVGIWSTMCNANVWLLAVALAVYVISQIISAFRINCLFKTIDLNFHWLSNIKLYWLGMFYNFFLPGGIGGDGYKVYFLKKHFGLPVKDLVIAMLGDRLSGLVAIGVYLLCFSSFFVEQLPIPFREYMFLLVPIVLLCYYLFLYIFKRCTTSVYWSVVSLSHVIQGLQMVSAALVLCSLDQLSLPQVVDYLFLFLASSIASAIPITLGGIGARELAFVFGSELLGVNQEIAVALSLLFYTTSLISSFPGIYYAIRPKRILTQNI